MGSGTKNLIPQSRAARRSRAASSRQGVPVPRQLTPAEQADRLVELFSLGQYEQTERGARDFTARFPNEPFGWKILAAALAGKQDLAAALEVYDRVVALAAGDWQFHNNYANALKTVGRLAEAEKQYREAIVLQPSVLEPHYNLGLTLIDLGRLQEAEVFLRRVLSLQPAHGMTHFNLANILTLQSRLAEAEPHFRQALAVMPQNARLLNNFAQLLGRQLRFADAEICYRNAIAADPNFAVPYVNLADLMANHGLLKDAELLLRHALSLDPACAEAHSNLLFTLCLMEQKDPATLFAEHRAFATHFELPLRSQWSDHPNSRDPERPLRLGFVSADFRDHPVMRYLMSALQHLNGYPDLTLYAYSNNVRHDRETDRYKQLFHHWRDVASSPDEALAKQIRNDEIDILFDLSGHSGHNRLLTFARKPAPLQISWIGYVGTTGLDSMDYFIADTQLVPEAFQSQFTEKILYVPATTCFQPCADAPEVNALPALRKGFFTFSSLARINKLNRALIGTWSEILRRAPESRLLLTTIPGGGVPRLLEDWFAAEGIPMERLIFERVESVAQTLQLHHEIDLCLDTLPYNGSTSSSHSLWMGVPILTVAGDFPYARMGTCLSNLIGLEGLVAASREEYIEKAVMWAQNSAVLAELRAGLRQRYANSIYQQPDVVTGAMVKSLRAAWNRWCQGRPPETF